MQIKVSFSTIPPYIAHSKVLEGWEDNDEMVLVCPSVLKPDAAVANDEDLFHLLTTLRYWIVNSIPDSVIPYVLSQPGNRCQEVLEAFARDLPYVHDLLVLTNLSGSSRWEMALQLDNLACVQYLHDNGFSCNSHDSCAIAAKAGSLSCLEYLHHHNFSWDAQTTASAAEGGSLRCLSYLHDNDCPWDASTTIASARYGHVICLAYALENGCPYNNDAALYSTAKGHASCLKVFLNVQAGPDPSFLMRLAEIAAAHKQLHCLQLLYSDHKCPLDYRPMVMAAKSGCLECLQYLHQLGCAWTDDVTVAAAYHGHLDCLRYAVENGCECCADSLYFNGVNGADVNDYLASLGKYDDWLHTDDEGDDNNEKEEDIEEEEILIVGSDAYWGLDDFIKTPCK